MRGKVGIESNILTDSLSLCLRDLCQCAQQREKRLHYHTGDSHWLETHSLTPHSKNEIRFAGFSLSHFEMTKSIIGL